MTLPSMQEAIERRSDDASNRNHLALELERELRNGIITAEQAFDRFCEGAATASEGAFCACPETGIRLLRERLLFSGS